MIQWKAGETHEKYIDYEERASLLKALSNPLRLRIVHGLLTAGCRNVSCMEAATGMSQSCISQHLQKLRAAGVVTAERAGNEVYYQVASRGGVLPGAGSDGRGGIVLCPVTCW